MSDSFWKKEISLSRKPKAPKAPKEPKLPKVAAEPSSFLKKEISFSRKPKEPKAPKAPKEPKLPKVAASSSSSSSSFLKKEISFSRRKRNREIERLAQAAMQSVAPVGFEPVVPPPPTAVAEAFVASMPDPEAPPAAPEPAESAMYAGPAAAPVEAAPDVLFVEHAPEPVDTLSTLAPAILAASAEQPVDLTPPPLEPPQEAPLEPPLEPQVVEAWTAEAAQAVVEPWLAEPELPPAPEAPAPVLVHPPVPASELPPLPDPAKAPFWKRELGRTKQPKQPKAPKGDSTPFWKKEIGGRKKAGRPVEVATETLPAVEAPRAPWWKKEIGGRKKQAPAVAREKSAPFWKRELSVKRPSAPTRSGPKRGKRGKGGHAPKRVVGLEIGASQIAAARIANNGSIELQQLAREPLASGVVVGGELRDPDALADALKAFFARHKLPRKGVRIGIASNRIGVRIFDIVGVDDDKQLANAVHFRAQEALPIPLDEAALDYRVLDEGVNEEGQSVKRVLLVVAHRELVDRYVAACRKAGITLSGIDLEAFALLRALAAPADRSGAAVVAVCIGHERSTFAVSDGRVCEFTRVLEWGGSSLNVALARAFDSTPSEVEALKRSLALDATEPPPGLSAEQAAVAIDALRKQIQAFARELVSSLQFYQNQPGSLGIAEIVLTGGTTHLVGLAEELERMIGVRVRVGDPLARLKVAKRYADPEQVGSLAVAIGLGIED